MTEFASTLPAIRRHIQTHRIAVTVGGRSRVEQRFTFIHVKMRAIEFTETVIKRLKRRSARRSKRKSKPTTNSSKGRPAPRLVINGTAVTFDQRTLYPDAEWIEILRLIIGAKGNPITARTMKARSKLLYEVPRIDRVIDKMRKHTGIPIQSERGKPGYWLSPDCPAEADDET